MSTFVLTYRAPKNYEPGSAQTIEAWNAYFDGLGTHIVDRGNPVFSRATLGDCGAGTVLGGYSIIDADDLEAALVLAKGCPFLGNGGGVEVGQLTILNAGITQIAG